MCNKTTIIVPEAVIQWLGSKILRKYTEIDIILEDYYKERQEAGLKGKKKGRHLPTITDHLRETLPVF